MSTAALHQRKYFTWLIIVVSLLALALPQLSGTNPRSRLALMGSLCEAAPQALRIDLGVYSSWTIDWAQTPDGKYYSNKAPGPSLLGWPAFCAVSGLLRLGQSVEKRSEFELGRIYVFDGIMSWLLQILPFLFALFYLLRALGRRRALTEEAQHWALLGALLGTTVTLFLNNFFGHAFSAWIWLWALALLLDHRWWAFGFALGLAFLSDYAALFAFPAFFAGAWLESRAAKDSYLKILGKIVLGAMPVALVFAWYHTQAFGYPWALPQKFQNPEFLDLKDAQNAVWGVIQLVPDFGVLVKLLFGWERGLLFSQPWILVVIVYTLLPSRKLMALKSVACVAIVGLLGYLLFNASFGAWQAGGSTGPRYLSPILPVFAALMALMWHELSGAQKNVLKATILYSVTFQFAALATTIVADPNSMYRSIWRVLSTRPATSLLRFSMLTLALVIWYFVFHRRKTIADRGAR